MPGGGGNGMAFSEMAGETAPLFGEGRLEDSVL